MSEAITTYESAESRQVETVDKLGQLLLDRYHLHASFNHMELLHRISNAAQLLLERADFDVIAAMRGDDPWIVAEEGDGEPE